MFWAADFVSSQVTAYQLANAGFIGRVRYAYGKDKQISQTEFDEATNTPGHALALVMESFGQAAQFGFSQGVKEAQEAYGRMWSMGWPKNRPIFFVGEDPNSMPRGRWPKIVEYFQGVLSVVHDPKLIGDYGSADQINHVMGLGLCRYGWAVETWPGNQSNCCLIQTFNWQPGMPFNMGGKVDPNQIRFLDWGQWSAVDPLPEPPKLPKPPVEETVIVSDQLQTNQLDTFHVDDTGRLMHYWFDTGETWHSEILAVECIPESKVGFFEKWSGDGMTHVFAERLGGGQVHLFWNGKAWGQDKQDPPT